MQIIVSLLNGQLQGCRFMFSAFAPILVGIGTRRESHATPCGTKLSLSPFPFSLELGRHAR